MTESIQEQGRLGFCCKWVDYDGLPQVSMNQRGTTITSLLKLPQDVRMRKMLVILEHNMATLHRQLEWLSTQPAGIRLFRITSDFVPASAHESFESIHCHPLFRQSLRSGLGWVRPFCDRHGIRLCTHPGQFTNLCSTDDGVVERSLLDIEHHADMATLMGYDTGWHPSGFAINVHGNIRQDSGLVRFRKNVERRLSGVARNLITIENDEFSCGVDDLVASGIGTSVAMVLDLHHHWIRSKGENLQPDDPRILDFIKSWRGVRPLSHASVTSEQVIGNWPADIMPDYEVLSARGHKPSQLRKHSRMMWNTAANDWILGHLRWTDIEIEAKGKNAASKGIWAYSRLAQPENTTAR